MCPIAVRNAEQRIRKLRSAIGRETCPARERRIGEAIERMKNRLQPYWRECSMHRASGRLLSRYA